MRDHTLLQAIARVNRPYENEAAEMVKPHGFVLDFVGIFDKLEKALAFDSDEINAIVKDLGLLKHLFKAKMETKAPAYLALVTQNFNDKDVDNLIEHFRDKERRKEFFKEYKEIEMLYEIISPDAFLRPFIENYATLSGIYEVVRNAYARRVYVDRAFQKKTNELVQRHIGAVMERPETEYLGIDRSTIETIKQRDEGKATKVINLVKTIEKTAEENSDDPFLVALSERAKAVQESFEDRQTSTEEALADLLKEIEKNEQRKKEQAAKGLDGLTYFVLCKLTDDGIPNPEPVSKKVREAFAKFPNWQRSEAELREVRKQVTFAVFAEEDDMAKVTATRRCPLHSAAEELSPMSAWRGREEFKARVLEWAAKLGVKASALYVRPMRRKWASCSTAGTFSFNDELLGLDRELGDYVIVHELLHFSVPNHGKLWKSLMRAHLGDYEKLEERLNEISERA